MDAADYEQQKGTAHSSGILKSKIKLSSMVGFRESSLLKPYCSLHHVPSHDVKRA